MCRLLALRGLRRLRGVRWMCTSLVGLSRRRFQCISIPRRRVGHQ